MKSGILVHLLWTGSERGGAQKFAADLSYRIKYILTTSIQKGSLLESLKYSGAHVNCKWFYVMWLSRIVIASDYRATCIALIYRFLFMRRFKVVCVIHSNRRSKLDFFLRFAGFFFHASDYIFVTTEQQFKTFNAYRFIAKLKIVRINFSERKVKIANISNQNVMFFGRISPEKCINLYLDFLPILKNHTRQYYVFGSGKESFIRKLNFKNCFFLNEWHDIDEVIDRYKIGFVVIPNKFEGISLVTIECIRRGVIPLSVASSAFDTLSLPTYLNLDLNGSIEEFINNLSDTIEKKVIVEACICALKEYEKKFPAIDLEIMRMLKSETSIN